VGGDDLFNYDYRADYFLRENSGFDGEEPNVYFRCGWIYCWVANLRDIEFVRGAPYCARDSGDWRGGGNGDDAGDYRGNVRGGRAGQGAGDIGVVSGARQYGWAGAGRADCFVFQLALHIFDKYTDWNYRINIRKNLFAERFCKAAA